MRPLSSPPSEPRLVDVFTAKLLVSAAVATATAAASLFVAGRAFVEAWHDAIRDGDAVEPRA